MGKSHIISNVYMGLSSSPDNQLRQERCSKRILYPRVSLVHFEKCWPSAFSLCSTSGCEYLLITLLESRDHNFVTQNTNIFRLKIFLLLTALIVKICLLISMAKHPLQLVSIKVLHLRSLHRLSDQLNPMDTKISQRRHASRSCKCKK